MSKIPVIKEAFTSRLGFELRLACIVGFNYSEILKSELPRIARRRHKRSLFVAFRKGDLKYLYAIK